MNREADVREMQAAASITIVTLAAPFVSFFSAHEALRSGILAIAGIGKPVQTSA